MQELIDALMKRVLPERLAFHAEAARNDGQRVLPFSIREAPFNSIVLEAIYRLIDEGKIYSSFAYNEAEIRRKKGGPGRADILWFNNSELCLIECKGPSYDYGSFEKDLEHCEAGLADARHQLETIKLTNWLRQYLFRFGYPEKAKSRVYVHLLALYSQLIIQYENEPGIDKSETEEKIKQFLSRSEYNKAHYWIIWWEKGGELPAAYGFDGTQCHFKRVVGCKGVVLFWQLVGDSFPL